MTFSITIQRCTKTFIANVDHKQVTCIIKFVSTIQRKVKIFHFASNLQEITPVLLLFHRHCKQIVTKREINCLGRVGEWVMALRSESKGYRFIPHYVVGRTLGPNLVIRLLVTFGSNKFQTQRLISG